MIQNVEKRPKYGQLMKTKFFVENSKRSDRNSTTKNWLESVNFLEPARQNQQPNGQNSFSTNPFLNPSKSSSTANTSHLTQLPLNSNSQIVNGSNSSNSNGSSWFGASAWNDAKPRAQGKIRILENSHFQFPFSCSYAAANSRRAQFIHACKQRRVCHWPRKLDELWFNSQCSCSDKLGPRPD